MTIWTLAVLILAILHCVQVAREALPKAAEEGELVSCFIAFTITMVITMPPAFWFFYKHVLTQGSFP